ncbi:MAG: AAA family ATPase [Deltaproteobacteria bacterium]|nr:AAA family ATPase [Deltaproteobacteria bacterium]
MPRDPGERREAPLELRGQDHPLSGLDPEQEAAATSAASRVLVRGGPGSGKTEALVARAAWRASLGCDRNPLFLAPTPEGRRRLEQALAARWQTGPWPETGLLGRGAERLLRGGLDGRQVYLDALDTLEEHGRTRLASWLAQTADATLALGSPGGLWGRRLGAEPHLLTWSHRCSGAILAVVEAVAGEPLGLRAGAEGVPVALVRCGGPQIEREFAVEQVAAAVGEASSPDRVAVLCPKERDCAPLRSALVARKLPVAAGRGAVGVQLGGLDRPPGAEVDTLLVMGVAAGAQVERDDLWRALALAREELILTYAVVAGTSAAPLPWLTDLPSWAVLYSAPDLVRPSPGQLWLF